MTVHPKLTEIRPGRMTPLARLPIFLALSGKRAVLGGGSAAAAWKAELLSAAGARVDVYAEVTSEELRALAAEAPGARVVLHERAWTPDDLPGAAVAVGDFATDNEAALFVAAARAAGVPVNIIDQPHFCDFAFGAIVNRSPLVIGISTDGAAPAFAQAIRAKLEALLPRGFAGWAAAAQRWRSAVKASGLSFAARRQFWRRFAARALARAEAEPRKADFDCLLGEVAALGAASGSGSLTLVGAGPGDPELLTLRGVRALQSADVILYEDRVSRDVLDFARREARKLLLGASGFASTPGIAAVDPAILALARAGKHVVLLTAGDPFGSGRGSTEVAACAAAGITIEVVPGIAEAGRVVDLRQAGGLDAAAGDPAVCAG